MFTTRNLLITGAAFLAMVVVFIATFDWSGDEDKDTARIAGRSVARTAPAGTLSPSPSPATGTAVEAVDTRTDEPVVSAPEPPREVTYEEAEAAFHEQRYGEAADLFARYTESKPDNPWGFYMLGLAAWKAGDNEQAEEAFGQSLALDQRHVKSYLSLSRVLLDTSRPAEVLDKIEEALAIDSESGVAYRLKGRACYQLGRMEEAIESYRSAIRLDNEDAWSMNNLALVYIEQGRIDEALPPLARAIELDGGVAIFHNNLGMALERSGRFRAAEAAYETAVALSDGYENAAANLARISEVTEIAGVEPLDLASIAQSFVDEIAGWSAAGVGQGETTNDGALESPAVVFSDAGVVQADSTDVDGNR